MDSDLKQQILSLRNGVRVPIYHCPCCRIFHINQIRCPGCGRFLIAPQ